MKFGGVKPVFFISSRKSFLKIGCLHVNSNLLLISQFLFLLCHLTLTDILPSAENITLKNLVNADADKFLTNSGNLTCGNLPFLNCFLLNVFILQISIKFLLLIYLLPEFVWLHYFLFFL